MRSASDPTARNRIQEGSRKHAHTEICPMKTAGCNKMKGMSNNSSLAFSSKHPPSMEGRLCRGTAKSRGSWKLYWPVLAVCCGTKWHPLSYRPEAACLVPLWDIEGLGMHMESRP